MSMYVGKIVDFIKLTSSLQVEQDERDGKWGACGAATQVDAGSQRHLNELTKCKAAR